MQDSFHRKIEYVRIAITDRCNLRCFYCMPKEGIPYEPKKELLSYEEIIRLLKILGLLGFKKVRFTGGEPFLRKDFVKLLTKTKNLGVYDSINITTNGTLLLKYLDLIKELGIKNINLSLDSLDPKRFNKITRRDDFNKVIETLNRLIDYKFNIKVNAVIMDGINNQDIIPLSKLALENNISIRYIEEMPFNGGNKKKTDLFRARDIFKVLKDHYPSINKKEFIHGQTATKFSVDGFKGDLGIIAAFSRTFCDSCNRLRITSKGSIKTCLYDNGQFSIRDFIRSGVSDSDIKSKFEELIKLKPKNGFEAEKSIKNSKTQRESMSMIGG
ncbi:MAG: GTP 3',8-cyclase MoaA [Flavobacteriaceae bacterium]|nr:GTP 3',8-cyclase MoaA [Flavobacteriaceae bacterium]